MGSDDKGLLEDLIGETLEEPSVQGSKPARATSPPPHSGGGDDDFGMGAAGTDPLGDDQLMDELMTKKPSGGNKKLIFLSIILLGVGLLGAAVRFGFIPAPLKKMIYDPNKKVDVTKVKISDETRKNIERMRQEQLKKKALEQKQPEVNSPLNEENPPDIMNPSQVASTSNPPDTVPENPTLQAQSTTANQAIPMPKSSEPVTPEKADESALKSPTQTSKPVEKVPPPQEPASAKTQPPTQLAKLPPQKEPVTVPKRPKMDTLSGDYSLRVGAYLFKSSLKAPMEKVVKLGFQPEINVIQRRVAMNQVFVGNFQSVQVAQAAIKDLSQEGIQSTITQRPNGNYSAIAGTFFYRKEADRQKSRLEEFGFDVTVEKVKVLSNLQELRVGAYPNEEAARGDLARLKSEGLTAVIVGP